MHINSSATGTRVSWEVYSKMIHYSLPRRLPLASAFHQVNVIYSHSIFRIKKSSYLACANDSSYSLQQLVLKTNGIVWVVSHKMDELSLLNMWSLGIVLIWPSSTVGGDSVIISIHPSLLPSQEGNVPTNHLWTKDAEYGMQALLFLAILISHLSKVT